MSPAFFHKVHNRGASPEKFIAEMIEWAKKEASDVFAPNDRFDIYDIVKPVLGPWDSLLHRKAVMLEVLRVLADSSLAGNGLRALMSPTLPRIRFGHGALVHSRFQPTP